MSSCRIGPQPVIRRRNERTIIYQRLGDDERTPPSPPKALQLGDVGRQEQHEPEVTRPCNAVFKLCEKGAPRDAPRFYTDQQTVSRKKLLPRKLFSSSICFLRPPRSLFFFPSPSAPSTTRPCKLVSKSEREKQS